MNATTKLIESFKTITGVSFINIKNYVSKGSNDTEMQDVLVNIGVSYESAKLKDIETLKSLNTDEVAKESKKLVSDIETARQELIGSLISPRKANSEGQKDAYTVICNGVKIHNETGQIYIFAMKVRKTVKVEGEFKEVKSSAKTLAKKYMQNKYMKSTKYRNYIIDRVENVKVSGDTVEIS